MTLRMLLGVPALAILALTAASPLAAHQGACGTPLAGWTTARLDNSRVFNTVTVQGENDRIPLMWNGAPVTHDQVRKYVEIVATLKPVPALVLTVAPSANCSEVKRLREMIEKKLTCNNGQCVELSS